MPPAHHCETYMKHLTGVYGYPLWTPQLRAELPDNYQYEGVKIGDVGIVSSLDGSFDVLFNITLPRDRQPDPSLLREDFVPVRLDQERHIATQDDAFLAHDIVPSASVELTSQHIEASHDQTPSRAEYEFTLSTGNGAVLILPEGAQSRDLRNEKRFLNETFHHAVDWYESATEAAGRLIGDDSLYLITGFHKARSWSLGATGQNIKTRRSMKFKVGQIREGSVTAEAYSWERTHYFKGRVGPMHPYEIGRGVYGEVPNQAVFIRGFRITVNKMLFLKRVTIETRQRTFKFIGFGSHPPVGTLESTPSSETEGDVDNTVDQDSDSLTNHTHFGTGTHVTIDRIPEISQTFHPGDSINQYMLRENPHAMVAVTHDSLWIEMLRMKLLELADFSREQRLHEVLSKYYRMIIEDGTVYFEGGDVSWTAETATPRVQVEQADSPLSSQNNKSTIDEQPHPESRMLLSGTPTDSTQVSDSSDLYPGSAGKEQAKEGTSVDFAPQVLSVTGSDSDAVCDATSTPLLSPPYTESLSPFAFTLLQQLAPPVPEPVSELLESAQRCIYSVVFHLRQSGKHQAANDEEIISNLICAAITAIRDLLYVSGPSFRHSGGEGRADRGVSASQTPLVPAQRRVIAALSKFVLSAQAVLNDGSWIASDDVSQLNADAEELESSVVEFVHIAQDVRNQGIDGPKRLHGYLSAPHAGPAKAGAGAAGTWQGFGWVDIEDHQEAPRRNLTTATFNEFVDHTTRVRERLSSLTEVLRATRHAEGEVVITCAQELLRQLSTLVLFLGDIHIARHVDIETVDESKLSDRLEYMAKVEKARVLVRSFEGTAQAIYDDGAALLATAQQIRRVKPCESWKGRVTVYNTLETLSSSLDLNLKISQQNLEGLMRIGMEQTAILERSHKTPFEYRISQRNFASAILTNQTLEAAYDNHGASNVTEDESDRILKGIAEVADGPPSVLPGPSEPPPVPTSGKSRSLVDNLESKRVSFDDFDALITMLIPPRVDKIKKFFGNDAPSHYLDSATAGAKPWYLRLHYNPEEVLIDPDGTVRGGTVPALVERLTAHEYSDPNFTRAFLMTFKSFTTLDELFNLLVKRFWIQPPPNLNSHELEEWRRHKQNIVRIRVINTMKLIVQDEDLVDREDTGILDRMSQFASGNDVVKIAAAKQLLAAIAQVYSGKVRRAMPQPTVPPPAPIVPKRVELLDIDPLELARQLTITESHLYLKIQPSECLQRSKQTRTEFHDGVANFIRRSNRVAHWVTYSILCKDEPRRRAAIMKHFIFVADRCRTIQNFSTMMAIVTGLNSSPIHRLKRSWEQVNSRYMSQLGSCEALINSYKHYNNYRSTLATVTPPCVPFVGVFLTALTHIQDGSKDYLPGDLVNFRKRQKLSEVIQDLQRWQTRPHNFHPLPSVLVFIDKSLSEFGDHDASEVFWRLSLEREPGEKDEEKMAKLLTDSGFN